VWISKAGFDAATATDDQLLLGLGTKTEQMVMTGTVNSFPSTVPWSLPSVPYVLLTSTIFNSFTDGGATSGIYFIRPFPWYDTDVNVQAAVSATGVTLTGGNPGSFWVQTPSCHYSVFRRAMP
jgi:hypothetical protein